MSTITAAVAAAMSSRRFRRRKVTRRVIPSKSKKTQRNSHRDYDNYTDDNKDDRSDGGSDNDSGSGTDYSSQSSSDASSGAFTEDQEIDRKTRSRYQRKSKQHPRYLISTLDRSKRGKGRIGSKGSPRSHNDKKSSQSHIKSPYSYQRPTTTYQEAFGGHPRLTSSKFSTDIRLADDRHIARPAVQRVQPDLYDSPEAHNYHTSIQDNDLLRTNSGASAERHFLPYDPLSSSGRCVGVGRGQSEGSFEMQTRKSSPPKTLQQQQFGSSTAARGRGQASQILTSPLSRKHGQSQGQLPGTMNGRSENWGQNFDRAAIGDTSWLARGPSVAPLWTQTNGNSNSMLVPPLRASATVTEGVDASSATPTRSANETVAVPFINALQSPAISENSQPKTQSDLTVSLQPQISSHTEPSSYTEPTVALSSQSVSSTSANSSSDPGGVESHRDGGFTGVASHKESHIGGENRTGNERQDLSLINFPVDFSREDFYQFVQQYRSDQILFKSK